MEATVIDLVVIQLRDMAGFVNVQQVICAHSNYIIKQGIGVHLHY